MLEEIFGKGGGGVLLGEQSLEFLVHVRLIGCGRDLGVAEIGVELLLLLLLGIVSGDVGRFVGHSGIGQGVASCGREVSVVDGESSLGYCSGLRDTWRSLLEALRWWWLLAGRVFAVVLSSDWWTSVPLLLLLLLLLEISLLDHPDLLLMLLHQSILIAELLQNVVLLRRQIGLVLLQMLQKLELLLGQILGSWGNGGSAIGRSSLLLLLILGSLLGRFKAFVGDCAILSGCGGLLGIWIGWWRALRGLQREFKNS